MPPDVRFPLEEITALTPLVKGGAGDQQVYSIGDCTE